MKSEGPNFTHQYFMQDGKNHHRKRKKADRGDGPLSSESLSESDQTEEVSMKAQFQLTDSHE